MSKSSILRNLHLQEHHSKRLLEKYGCAIQHFIVANIFLFAERYHYVVKAMVLAGGRGKGRFIGGRENFGGVFVTKDRNEVLDAVQEMIGKRLVTKQTGKDGILVKEVMIAEGVAIKRETYLAILMDRELSCPVIVHSPAGGMDIETVSRTKPHLIFKEPIDISKGISNAQAEKVAKNLGFEGPSIKKAAHEVKQLYELFIGVDATQVEINPLVETKDGQAFCVDAKLNFDDSAEYRQKEIFSLNSDEAEVSVAKKFNLNYIPLEGNIGCLVNGAGLAMATMDIIKLSGGNPANFLDVGGTVTDKAVSAAFSIILSDPKVEGILVNIFGGIVNCKTIANGMIDFFQREHLKVPLVVRLEGTNVEEAKLMLKESGLPIIFADNLEAAAKKVVEVIQKK
ncbi:unnamed protein product [Enterobius vermicularis]|uniref:Succinate--CoA ligase [ADP-forming] subunit beta, mitochondrial n=1 Tax=Enterobius vermicularis TaxID=51028 RepID=A0A0N4VIP0_ENTVE|nr:unnamed protein product [Enterobius vermicularis]